MFGAEADMSQLDCASSVEGVKGLREEYEEMRSGGSGLENTTEWLDDEEAILAKMPLLERRSIGVSLISGGETGVADYIRAGKPSGAKTEDGSPLDTPSTRSESI